MLVNLCWGKWVTSLIKDMLVNILLLYFSLFLQKLLKNWTWWRKTFNLRRRRFWHAVRVVLKNTHTHITSSHRKFRYAEFILWFTTFFAVSLLLTFLGRLGLCILFFLGDLLPMLQIISRQLISRTVMAGRTDWIFARRDIHHQMPTITKGDQMMIVICFMRSLFSWDSILSPPWQSPLTLFLAYFQSTQNIVIKAPGWYRYV